MKKILSLFLILSMLVCLPAYLVSCAGDGNKDPGTLAPAATTAAPTADDGLYSVTLVDNEGQPIVGANVMITNGTSIFESGTTDANGKFAKAVTGTGLGVMIVSNLDGYVKPTADASGLHAMFGDQKNITITVQKQTTETVTYTVKVIDQNGAPVAGVKLQVCATVCYDCPDTDANGISTKELAPDLALKVMLLELPQGYTAPDPIDADGYHAKIDAGETTVTVTVVKN